MPKAIENMKRVSPFHNLSAGDLADQHGFLAVAIGKLEARRKEIAAELIGRGVGEAEGVRFRSVVIAETSIATLDRAAVEREMGEPWIARFLKWSTRSTHVKTTPRAAAIVKLAA